MSQQSPDPSAKTELTNDPPDCATEAPGDMMTMTEFLFSELPLHPPGEPVRPPRFVPVASKAWSFLWRYYDRSEREPPGATPYYCDRCKPWATPMEAKRSHDEKKAPRDLNARFGAAFPKAERLAASREQPRY